MRHVERIARAFRRAYAEHQLATHTAAIAFQVLIALVPLTLLGLALLGALGLEDVWTSSIAPTMRGKLSPPVFEAIDYSVKKIFADNSPGLIVFASLLLAWQLAWAERAVGAALNAIHEAKETRSLPRRVLLAVGLGVAVGALVVTSVLVAAVVPRLANGGLALGLKLVGFLGAAVLLTVAIGLLVRYSPAEHPEVRWASAGSALVVVSWLLASLAFGWFASAAANFKSASGNLTVFLFLTAYVTVSAAIFLIGVELDELARRETKGARHRKRRRLAA